MKVTAQTISQILNGEIEGNPDVIITHPAKIEEGTDGSICFLANPKYEIHAYTTQASALLVSKTFEAQKEAILAINKLRSDFDSMYSLASVRHSIDTTDSFYESENDFFNFTKDKRRVTFLHLKEESIKSSFLVKK